MPTSPRLGAPATKGTVVLSMLSAGLVLAACGSSTSSSKQGGSGTGGSSSSATSSSGGSANTGVTHAMDQISKYHGLTTSFPSPGSQIKGLAKFRGQTVTYIPIFLQAGYFTASAKIFQQTADAAGVKLQVCDGQGTPATIAACFNQAVSGKSAGIITDAIPVGLAANAYAAAAAAKIPVVVANTEETIPANIASDVKAISVQQSAQLRLAADVVIAASKGSTDVLAAVLADSATTTKSAGAMSDEFATNCPGCKVHVLTTTSQQLQKVPTLVGTALLNNPNTQYVLSQYNSPLGLAVRQGLTQANKAASLKLVGSSDDIAAMQRVKSGEQFANVSNDLVAGAWNETDLLLRMMTGTVADSSKYTLPIRVFYRADVTGLNISDQGYLSGEWFSGGGFKDMYKKLWSSS